MFCEELKLLLRYLGSQNTTCFRLGGLNPRSKVILPLMEALMGSPVLMIDKIGFFVYILRIIVQGWHM